LLDQLILFRRHRARQMLFLTGHVVATEQMSQVWEMLCPGEFLQQAAQANHTVHAREGGERRVVRAQQSQPTEDMGIAAQLLERANFRIVSA
jgi:hypothetical protein